MKLAISAGGTGGHIFPALALAEAFLERDRINEIIFFGIKGGMEKGLLSERGFRFFEVRGGRFAGRNIKERLHTMLGLMVGVFQALLILKREKPLALLSFGGYTSVPPSLAAYLLRIPLFLHEQNVEPGLANRFLSFFANSIFVSFAETRKFFKRRSVYITGNPLRRDIKINSIEKKTGLFTIFVLGGSRGATSINRAIIEALPYLEKKGEFFLIHQTGFEDYEKVSTAYEKTSLEYEVFPFREKIGPYYCASDLVISRAGANAIFEISFFRKPAILIPYPYSAKGHQYSNAEYVQKIGGAILLEDRELSGKRIFDLIETLFHDRERLKSMGEKIGSLYIENAEKKILEILMERIKK